MQKQFKVGKVYKMGWIGDSTFFTFWEVIKRTDKTITIKDQSDGQIKTCRIDAKYSSAFETEVVWPLGKGSMCPILKAEKEM